jgi:hypothetical protein
MECGPHVLKFGSGVLGLILNGLIVLEETDISKLEDDIHLSLNVGHQQPSEAAAQKKRTENSNKISAKAKQRVQFGEVFLSFGQFVLPSNNIKHKTSNFICCFLCQVLSPSRSMLMIADL